MLRRLAPLLLAPLLASCAPPDHVVRAVFFGTTLAFVAADPGDSDATGCWREGTVVDDSLRPLWRFSGPGTGECRRLFPVFYGRAPEGTQTAVAAAAPEAGRLYLFVGNATGEAYGAFAFTRAGANRIVHNVDPSSPAAQAIRERWWQRSPGIADSPPPPAETAP